MQPEAPRRLPCPECGQEFHSRGLAAHRRQRHGTGVQAALPAPVPGPDVNQIMSALQLLRGAVERIDEHLRVVEANATPIETPTEELQRLEFELELLLEEIGKLQNSASAPAADAPAGPLPSEMARMRREQARLVFRIDELKTGSPNEERFLT